MSKTNLEKDAWIHRHVFEADLFVGLKKRGVWYRPDAKGYTDRQSEAGRYTRAEAKKHEYLRDEPVTIHEFEPEKYTTDPAASRELEKKIFERLQPEGYELCIGLYTYMINEPPKWMVCTSNKRGHQSIAPTIEQAIADFAIKLWGGEV